MSKIRKADAYMQAWFNFLFYVGAIVCIALVMSVALSGCYTERKAQSQVDKAWHKYPLVPAKFCADKFDPTDSVSIVKEYIQGEDIVFTDTVVEVLQSLDTVTIVKYLTRTVKTVDTVRDTKYVTTENKGKILLLNAEVSKLQATIATSAETLRIRTRWLWILGGVIGVYVIYKVVRGYFKGKAKFVGI